MSERLTILQGESLSVLRSRAVPDGSVQTCVTSPPFWGLRDYGVPPSVWMPFDTKPNFEGCRGEHDWREHIQPAANGIFHDGGMSGETLSGASATRRPKKSAFCSVCGAWAGCLGLEPTPELFVQHLVAIFREVRRVLRDDGTLWVNLGDSYARNPGRGVKFQGGNRDIKDRQSAEGNRGPEIPPGLKEKDLVGIPWMVAFALRSDGWYLRSDIIWHKPNCMPESIKDRPSRCHEYVFLLSKSPRYYYDHEAIKEPASESFISDSRWKTGSTPENDKGFKNSAKFDGKNALKQDGHGRRHGGFNARWDEGERTGSVPETRNKRDVWTISPANFPDAHFATYPPDLIKPCILAGSRTGDVVLDPFGGSGTTGMVALELGRKAVLIELNAEYVKLIHRRCDVTPGLPL